MFFQRMLPLLGLCQAINITMSQDGDLICLVINPTANANSPAGLRVPQVLRGTAQELDEGISEFLASLSLGIKSIQDQIAENEALIQAEKERLKDVAKSKEKVKPNTKQGKPESTDDDDEDENKVSTGNSSESQSNISSSESSPGSTETSLIPEDLFGGDE